MPRLCCIALIVALSSSAGAENFGRRFDEGYAMLEAGNADGALQTFLDLKTETPESRFVDYSIASALYGQGMKAINDEEWEIAVEKFTEAREGFGQLGDVQGPFLREHVPFGSANCTTQLAKLLDPAAQYKERIEALQNSIQIYEFLVEKFPGNDPAKTNLNHTRFLLKSMLQNPPPDQRRADGGEGDGDEGENQQQSDQDQEGDRDQEGEQQEGEEQSDADQQNESDASQGQNDEPSDSQQNQSQSQPLEDQNIEAILQSLEDKNRDEQKNLRRARGAPQVKDGKWW